MKYESVKQIAWVAKKAGAALYVTVGPNKAPWSELPYQVAIVSTKPCFPSPFIQGGLTSRYVVGNSKTQNSAKKNANRLIRQLQKEDMAIGVGMFTIEED
jgi:hypothetical protein